jgi:hypothetical protein
MSVKSSTELMINLRGFTTKCAVTSIMIKYETGKYRLPKYMTYRIQPKTYQNLQTYRNLMYTCIWFNILSNTTIN